jgi:uncharacterized membrane protein YkvA (DUF1232 family)
MSLAITIELSDDDLKYFADAMQSAQKESQNLTAQEITDAASKLLQDGKENKLPAFISDRLSKIASMVAMVNDAGFGMEEADKKRVLACLTYFANPKDIIPDNVPVLGFLDDAIMIELVVRELQHEVEAYDDFVEYREDEARRRGVDPSALKTERVEWAEARRLELLSRMKSRRMSSYSSSSGWRPSLFKFGG